MVLLEVNRAGSILFCRSEVKLSQRLLRELLTVYGIPEIEAYVIHQEPTQVRQSEDLLTI